MMWDLWTHRLWRLLVQVMSGIHPHYRSLSQWPQHFGAVVLLLGMLHQLIAH